MGGLPLSKSPIISPKDALALMSGLDVLLSSDLSMDDLGMDSLVLDTCIDCLCSFILVMDSLGLETCIDCLCSDILGDILLNAEKLRRVCLSGVGLPIVTFVLTLPPGRCLISEWTLSSTSLRRVFLKLPERVV